MDWKQYESTALIYFCIANRFNFETQIEERGHCLEGNQGDEDRLHIWNDSTGQNSFLKNWSVFKDGGTVLNRIQVQRTGIPKKIRWIQGNKSDSPHLRGKFLIWIAFSRGGLISGFCFELRSLHEYTRRALAAAHGLWRRGFVFYWSGPRLPPPGWHPWKFSLESFWPFLWQVKQELRAPETP